MGEAIAELGERGDALFVQERFHAPHPSTGAAVAHSSCVTRARILPESSVIFDS
jgi:hypothetical protein